MTRSASSGPPHASPAREPSVRVGRPGPRHLARRAGLRETTLRHSSEHRSQGRSIVHRRAAWPNRYHHAGLLSGGRRLRHDLRVADPCCAEKGGQGVDRPRPKVRQARFLHWKGRPRSRDVARRPWAVTGHWRAIATRMPPDVASAPQDKGWSAARWSRAFSRSDRLAAGTPGARRVESRRRRMPSRRADDHDDEHPRSAEGPSRARRMRKPPGDGRDAMSVPKRL